MSAQADMGPFPNPVPQGRLKIGLHETLDNLQPSLRD
jgi:hypothetical protein